MTLIAMMVWLSDLGFTIPWYVWTLLVLEVLAIIVSVAVKAAR